MSFGFSIGDFITVLQLTQKIWKQFSDAPAQYQAINAEVRNVSHVLQEISDYAEENDISNTQQIRLSDIIASLHGLLKETEKIISKRSSLSTKDAGLKQRAKRIWAQVTFEPEDIRDLRQRIVSNLIALHTFVSGLDRGSIARLARIQDKQMVSNILDWLVGRDYAAQHSSNLSRCLPETGQWFLNLPDFQTWVDGSDGLLLQAIPGVGKTILTAVVVDYLQNIHGPNDNVGICYYYCDYKRQDHETLKDNNQKDNHELDLMLLSFIRQLSEPFSAVSPYVHALYNKHRKSSTHMTLEDARAAFYSCVRSFDKVYVVVDALDEIQLVNGSRRALLLELASMSATHGISVLATSRVLPDITNALQGFGRLEIKADDGDLDLFIASNLPRLPNFVAKNVSLQHEIKDAIVMSADGIFLLATLHIQSLMGKKSPGALRRALKLFGMGTSAYKEAYDKSMRRITGQVEDQKELAIDTLTWIVYAQRPLKVIELLHALATNIDDESAFDPDDISDIEDVLSACCGLVIIESKSGIVRLVHRTAQEFFRDPQCTWLPDAHTKLTKVCLAYLSLIDSSNNSGNLAEKSYQEQLAQHPLWDYATWYWEHHAELQEKPMPLEEFATKQLQIDASSQMLIDHSMPEYLELSREYPGITGLHLVAKCGSVSLIPFFLESHDINARDRHQQTPLSYAVQGGYRDAVVLLVDAGAHLNDLYNLQDDLERRSSDNPQYLLIWSIQFKTQVAEVLISRKARLDIADEQGRNPLHWAILTKNHALIRLLLEEGLDLRRTDSAGRTPVFYAIQQRYLAGIELLVTTTNAARDAGVSDQLYPQFPTELSEDKIEVLTHAVKEARFPVILWLIRIGVAIDMPNVSGRTSLMHAAEAYNKETLAFLIECGADVRAADRAGSTVLHYATRASWQYDTTGPESIEKTSKEIVLLLLENGANVNAADKMGRTALMKETRRPVCTMAAFLLENGARVNDIDLHGRSALSLAMRIPFEERRMLFVSLLLKYGADVTVRCHTGRTPLDDAVMSGSTATVRLLLKASMNSSILGKEDDNHNYKLTSWSPLHWACRRGNIEMIILLINAGMRSSVISTERTASPKSKWMPLDIAYFWDQKSLLGTIEAISKQDPMWFSMVSSSIVVVGKDFKLVAARENGLSSSHNSDLHKACLLCEGAEYTEISDDHLCFMCKHERAVRYNPAATIVPSFAPPRKSNAGPPDLNGSSEGGVYFLRDEFHLQIAAFEHGIWKQSKVVASQDPSTPLQIIKSRFLVSKVPGNTSFSFINLFYGVPVGNFDAPRGIRKLYGLPRQAMDPSLQWYIAKASNDSNSSFKWIFQSPTKAGGSHMVWDVEGGNKGGDLLGWTANHDYDDAINQHWRFDRNTALVRNPWYAMWPIADYDMDLASASWMANVPDETALSQMNIPGTHRSLALHEVPISVVKSNLGLPDDPDHLSYQARLDDNPRCQNRSPYEQLYEGIRSLDLRFRIGIDPLNQHKSLYARHNKSSWLPGDGGYSLMAVLHTLKVFLSSNTKETVFVSVEREVASDDEMDFWILFLQEAKFFADNYPRLFYADQDASLQDILLGSCRGKAIFISKELWTNKSHLFDTLPELRFLHTDHLSCFQNPDILFQGAKEELAWNLPKDNWAQKLADCKNNVHAAAAADKVYITRWCMSVFGEYNPWDFAREASSVGSGSADAINLVLSQRTLGQGTIAAWTYCGFVTFDFYELYEDAIQAVIKSNRGCGGLTNFKKRPLR